MSQSFNVKLDLESYLLTQALMKKAGCLQVNNQFKYKRIKARIDKGFFEFAQDNENIKLSDDKLIKKFFKEFQVESDNTILFCPSEDETDQKIIISIIRKELIKEQRITAETDITKVVTIMYPNIILTGIELDHNEREKLDTLINSGLDIEKKKMKDKTRQLLIKLFDQYIDSTCTLNNSDAIIAAFCNEYLFENGIL